MTPLQLRLVDNAFKHGVTKDEIWEVFLNRNLPGFDYSLQKERGGKDL